MGIGIGSGPNRATEAAQLAIASPLLNASIEGATGVLLNISGGSDIGLFEVNEAAELVTAASDASANVIFGAVIDESLKGDVRVTVIATGFGAGGEHRRWRATRKGEPRRETAPETFEVPSEVLEIPSFLRED
jgi:cell division protein FtsZ